MSIMLLPSRLQQPRSLSFTMDTAAGGGGGGRVPYSAEGGGLSHHPEFFFRTVCYYIYRIIG